MSGVLCRLIGGGVGADLLRDAVLLWYFREDAPGRLSPPDADDAVFVSEFAIVVVADRNPLWQFDSRP